MYCPVKLHFRYCIKMSIASKVLKPLFTNRNEECDDIYKEPKFVVFYSVLLSLFSMFCFKCRQNTPTVKAFKTGTMVTLIQNCPKCGDSSFKWVSQPLILGKYPAGNILLSFGILMAGASVSKILPVFKHMGMCAIRSRTFFIHQSKLILPSILLHWETYRGYLVEKVKMMEGIVWSGDGRFDSMGHSAKYGTYSMFCSPMDKIVHFELLQVIGNVVNFYFTIPKNWQLA